VFLVNGRTRSPGVLDVHEFILVVHTFLTLSHEEMIEHCFSCMADTITEGGHLAVNMRKIVKRYPKLARANRVQHAGNEMLVTEFTNLAEARNIMVRKQVDCLCLLCLLCVAPHVSSSSPPVMHDMA